MQTHLAGLGRRPDLKDELAELGDPDLIPARVLAQHRGRWLVGHAGPTGLTSVLVPARARLNERPDGPPVAGDWIALDGGGAIAHILERHGAIVRHDVGTRSQAQTLAANVDVALVVEAFPAPNLRRAERLLALATVGAVHPVLVLSKADLEPDAALAAPQAARALGLLEAYAVTTEPMDDQTGPHGLAPLRCELEPGSTAVLLGISGAGKSTLANALLGHERQATAPVRAGDGRGRHTTVTRELLPLPSGALLIDTPGIRRVNVWDGTGTAFADVEELAASCRFADCRHETEPGCAVREGVGPERLAAWRKLEREQAWVDDRRAAEQRRAQLGRHYTRIQRNARRHKGDEG